VLKVSPDKFWDFSAKLFEKQADFFDVSVVNETRNATYKRLATIAGSVGVNEDEGMLCLLAMCDFMWERELGLVSSL
jgi:hypothetical protein